MLNQTKNNAPRENRDGALQGTRSGRPTWPECPPEPLVPKERGPTGPNANQSDDTSEWTTGQATAGIVKPNGRRLRCDLLDDETMGEDGKRWTGDRDQVQGPRFFGSWRRRRIRSRFFSGSFSRFRPGSCASFFLGRASRQAVAFVGGFVNPLFTFVCSFSFFRTL